MLESRVVDAPGVDPRVVDSPIVDPRVVDAPGVDPRVVDSPIVDPRVVDSPTVRPPRYGEDEITGKPRLPRPDIEEGDEGGLTERSVDVVVPNGKHARRVRWESAVVHELDVETGRHITRVVGPTNLNTAEVVETQDAPLSRQAGLLAGNLRIVPKSGGLKITAMPVRDRMAKGATQEGEVDVDQAALVGGKRPKLTVAPNSNSVMMQTAPGRNGNPRRKPSSKRRPEPEEEEMNPELTLILSER